MKFELKFLTIAFAAIVLAIPVSTALHHQTNQQRQATSQAKSLQLQLKTTKEEVQLKNSQLEKKANENADLQKQLQTKRDAVNKVAVAAPSLAVGDCGGLIGLVSQYDWNVPTALAIMKAESGCVASKENATDGHRTCQGSRGLFQIGCDSTPNYAGMFDAAANVAQAHALYVNRGWSPWTTFTSGAYLKYL